MRGFKADSLTELHEGMCRTIVNSRTDQLDMVTSVDVQIHNIVAEARRLDWDFDMKDMWLTPSRWTMMCRQYLDGEDVLAWLERSARLIGPGGRGISMLRTKAVNPRGGPSQGNKETRRWGSCMLAVSYKAMPAPQITLYSRTSYLGYLAALDLSVAWMLGRYLGEMMGMPVEDMRFVWYNEAIQYHHFKSLAYFLNHPNEDEQKAYRRLMMKSERKLKVKELERIEASPALIYSRRWMQKLLKEDRDGVTLGDMNYNTYRRIRRRFHTEVMGIEYAKGFEGWSYYKLGEKKGEQKEFFKAYGALPHTPISSRDLCCIGLPSIAQIKHLEYDADAASATEEDDDDD